MFNRALASAKVDCPVGQGYDGFIVDYFRRVFPAMERGGFLFIEDFGRFPRHAASISTSAPLAKIFAGF
jgi:hypothetical protein